MAEKPSAIEELRKRMERVEPLEGEPEFFTNPETLVRFLKAREWDLDKAEKLLKNAVEWRRKNKPLTMDCRWCHEKPGFHNMRQVGFDEMGRPVIYSCFAQASSRRNNVDDSIAHATYLIENAKVTMKPGIHTWVFIIDCTGMTVPACSPKLGYGVTQVMSNHYPERLGLVICLNHNALFQGVWKAIKVFLHQNTVAKVKFVRSKQKILDVFHEYFNEELTDWLITEIKRNKTRPLTASQKQFWKTDPVHDPRGTPSYVAKYVEPYAAKSLCNLKELHKPHPNIVDECKGDVQPISAISSADLELDDQLGDLDLDKSDDENGVAEIEISEEFQIPKDAEHL
ncbi:unnamed protein product [Owenia fusiformis]|uniref:Uncharacterized protein n=1 Tax=Owenia fusiformis TaxID=6347 RepID=A0A8J1Y9S7_OWEFU|nr:unnamed protein product [Owenia fusiformis]